MEKTHDSDNTSISEYEKLSEDIKKIIVERGRRKLEDFYDPKLVRLLNKLYHDIGYSFPSKKKFYEAVSAKYPNITYKEVSDYMDSRKDYVEFVHGTLMKENKLIGPKPHKIKTESEKRQYKTGIYVMKPNHKWQMDLIDLGERKNKTEASKKYNYIFTIIDVFSKYAFAIPIEHKSGEIIAYWLSFIFLAHKSPIYILSDNGKEFANEIIKALMNRYQIKHIFCRPYEHLGNIERFNQTLKRLIQHSKNVSVEMKDGKIIPVAHSLEELISSSLYKYNNSVHSAHKYSPTEVHFSKNEHVRNTARKILMNNLNKMNDEIIPYKVGDIVMVKTQDWPDIDPKVKKDIHNEKGTIGLNKILKRYGLKAYGYYRIESIYVPKSTPPVYLYRLQNIPDDGKDSKKFPKYYVHQQLELVSETVFKNEMSDKELFKIIDQLDPEELSFGEMTPEEEERLINDALKRSLGTDPSAPPK